MSLWFSAWRYFGLALLALLVGVVYLSAEGVLSIEWQSIKAFAWGAAFVHLALGVLSVRHLSGETSRVEDTTSANQDPPGRRTSHNPIDPWSYVRICKEGKMGYETLIELCEIQIEQGDEQSAAFLGWLYEYGPSNLRDESKSYAMYRIAALRGNETALDKIVTLERLSAKFEVMTDDQKAAWTSNIAHKLELGTNHAASEETQNTSTQPHASN